jgi:hypothetical protein
MSIILQFAHGEIKQTTAQLVNIQLLIGNANYEELVQMRVIRGEVVQILASDATEVLSHPPHHYIYKYLKMKRKIDRKIEKYRKHTVFRFSRIVHI